MRKTNVIKGDMFLTRFLYCLHVITIICYLLGGRFESGLPVRLLPALSMMICLRENHSRVFVAEVSNNCCCIALLCFIQLGEAKTSPVLQ
jgi:hypothetical protein